MGFIMKCSISQKVCISHCKYAPCKYTQPWAVVKLCACSSQYCGVHPGESRVHHMVGWIQVQSNCSPHFVTYVQKNATKNKINLPLIYSFKENMKCVKAKKYQEDIGFRTGCWRHKNIMCTESKEIYCSLEFPTCYNQNHDPKCA
jgi:hypothetical protein